MNWRFRTAMLPSPARTRIWVGQIEFFRRLTFSIFVLGLDCRIVIARSSAQLKNLWILGLIRKRCEWL